MSIDLGVNNLASIVTNTNSKPVLIDGRKLKSINQYYNKKRSKIQQQLKKSKWKRKFKTINISCKKEKQQSERLSS